MKSLFARRLGAALAEWLPCVPCLFLQETLPLYWAGALLVLAARLCLTRTFLLARLNQLAFLLISLTAIALFYVILTPWLLIPCAPFAETRLIVVLAGVPVMYAPTWVLIGLASLRTLSAAMGLGIPPTASMLAHAR